MKLKQYFKTFACVFLVLLFMTLGACNRGEIQTGDVDPDYVANVTGHITVSYPLATDEESKLSLRYFAQAFMSKYREATVNLDFSMGNTDARIASGDIGDVFFIWEEDTYTYAIENKVLMPIDAYLEVLGIDISNVYAGVYDLGTADGRLYMAARDFTQHVIIYNATALEEAGLATPPADWTWEEFKEYCRKLTKEEADGTLSQIGAGWNGANPPILISFLEGWGGKWYDTVNKRISFISDDKVLKGFSEQIEAMEEGILKPTGISGAKAEKYSRLSFENTIFRSNVFPGMHNAGMQYEALGLKWNLANWPRYPVHKVGAGATGFCVYNRTNAPDTAAAFALYLFTDEGQRAYNGQVGGSVPLTKKLANEDFWKVPYDPNEINYDAFISFPEAATVGKFHCRVPNAVANLIVDNIEDVFKRHFAGQQDYYDSLAALETLANEKWQTLFESEQR